MKKSKIYSYKHGLWAPLRGIRCAPFPKKSYRLQKGLDRLILFDMVHGMNQRLNRSSADHAADVPDYQLKQFQELILKLFQCCQERMQYQSERFGLPDAELRCLMLFGEERYLTAKGIAFKMNVVKSRVTKIVEGLLNKKLVQRIKDPEDSRFSLLSLTPEGHNKLNQINLFLEDIHHQILLQIAPDQRQAVLTNLDILKASMEAAKEIMI
jgi:DNA-binding MarR family transcriptional regulator